MLRKAVDLRSSIHKGLSDFSNLWLEMHINIVFVICFSTFSSPRSLSMFVMRDLVR